MNKHRVCVVWFENGEPKERGFRVPYDDTWHERVRAAEVKANAACDVGETTTVFSTSIDGESTEGFWIWDNTKHAYTYNELG
jgi:hypothetical protein